MAQIGAYLDFNLETKEDFVAFWMNFCDENDCKAYFSDDDEEVTIESRMSQDELEQLIEKGV